MLVRFALVVIIVVVLIVSVDHGHLFLCFLWLYVVNLMIMKVMFVHDNYFKIFNAEI